MTANENQTAWIIILLSSTILMIGMGIRQTTGLFINPIIDATGQSLISVSFALAVGQLIWGLAQPFFGAVADKKGSYIVLVIGTLLLSAGTALTAYADTEFLLLLTLGILMPAGAGAGSFSLLIGATSRQIPANKRALAAGVINAGGSMGQFVFAPLVQIGINAFGWIYTLFGLAAAALTAIPLSKFLCKNEDAPSARNEKGSANNSSSAEEQTSLSLQLKKAFFTPSYHFLCAGFFTCGFHVAFLTTHLPSEVALNGHAAIVSATSIGLIGFFNIGGSLAAGALGNYYRMKYILACMYGSRAIMILMFLAAPKTTLTFYVFSASMGFTWLATVPPTAGLIGKLFGLRYLATLLGLAVFIHQVGAFLGAWFGGLVMAQSGNYQWMWYADTLLAAFAAFINLPIKEKRLSEDTSI